MGLGSRRVSGPSGLGRHRAKEAAAPLEILGFHRNRVGIALLFCTILVFPRAPSCFFLHYLKEVDQQPKHATTRLWWNSFRVIDGIYLPLVLMGFVCTCLLLPEFQIDYEAHLEA